MKEGKLGVLINMTNIYETTETLNINQAVKKSYQTSVALFKNIKYLSNFIIIPLISS